MEHIEGTYVKSLFYDAENGRNSFILKRRDTEETVKVVGRFCLQQRGLPLCIDGNWKDSEYGKEFHIAHIALHAFDAESMEQFFKELGIILLPRQVKKLMEVTPEGMFEVSGHKDIEIQVSKRSGIELYKCVEIFTKIRFLIQELELFQIILKAKGNCEDIRKIMKAFLYNAMEVIESNPYEIIAKTDVSFLIIDRIAMERGEDPCSKERITAMLTWLIQRAVSQGDVYITDSYIYRAVSGMDKRISQERIREVLKQHPDLISDGINKERYYEKELYREEIKAAKAFARLQHNAVDLPFYEEYIDIIERKRGRKFGKEQREAFMLLSSTGIKLLTGDPGTGKTTTENSLLEYLELLWQVMYGRKPEIVLCAPSGRAAQRMKETTGRNALTVHKLIEYQLIGNRIYCKNEEDPLQADIVIVDEVSMLGISMFRKLLGAVKNGSLVLLVGDSNQLQSVDAGNVLMDLIDSGYVDRCHLTEVFRQGNESFINRNAKRIIQGRMPLYEGKDFALISCTPGETQKLLIQGSQRLIEESGDSDKIQILTPLRKGSCGVWKANELLQSIMNPDKGGICYGLRNFRPKDRVIMMNNNYMLDYYNGDIGHILEVDQRSMKIRLEDHEVILLKELYKDVDLAYACTIHKSQGSEYDYVLIVLQEEAMGMLDQNLLYTAVTRGRKKVVILYENDTISRAVTTHQRRKRNSSLADRIDDEMKKRY